METKHGWLEVKVSCGPRSLKAPWGGGPSPHGHAVTHQSAHAHAHAGPIGWTWKCKLDHKKPRIWKRSKGCGNIKNETWIRNLTGLQRSSRLNKKRRHSSRWPLDGKSDSSCSERSSSRWSTWPHVSGFGHVGQRRLAQQMFWNWRVNVNIRDACG